MAKLGAVLFCLVFLVTFGVVGIGATWAIASTIRDAVRAQDWVKVRASVDPLPAQRYRYAYQGREYTATRLGTFAMGGSDDLDDWSERLATYLREARESGKPIMVYVNPENPAEALIDRDIRWKLLIFLSPFAFVFGAVALGALYALVRILKASKPNDSSVATRDKRVVAASGDGSVASMWIFALFWNGLSWPVAILAVPEMLQEESWIGLFVLLFPFFGLMFLWAAIRTSFAALRGAKATPKLQTENPRAGAALAGSEPFAKRFPPSTPQFQTIEKLLEGRGAGPLSAEQKAALAKMTPEQQAQVAKVAAWAPSGKKLVFLIVGFVIAIQFVPFLLRLWISR